MISGNGVPYQLRQPCNACGLSVGRLVSRNGQDCVYCDCGRWQYNAPRVETGKAVRTVKTTHEAIKPSQRYRIIERANGSCELCHCHGRNLHIGHAVSVKDGHAAGLDDSIINSDENLLALCEECNLGQGARTLPMRLLMALLVMRTKGS